MDPDRQAATARAHSPVGLGVAWRMLLSLIRPEYIPTVVSNCIAGWWLSGGGNPGQLLFVFSGAAFMFVGGALLNDAFDIRFDRVHRRNRPIPSGEIGLRIVWRAGLLLLLLATVAFQFPGRVAGGLGMLLAFAVVLHNSLHRFLPLSDMLLGICRLLLYLLGASVASRGITGMAVWGGIAVAVFVSGLESLHRDPQRKRCRPWPALALIAPFTLASFMNTGVYLASTTILSALVLSWAALSWRALVFVSVPVKNGLNLFVPGIVLVDMLAACPAPLSVYATTPSAEKELCLLFGALFLCSILLALLQFRVGISGAASSDSRDARETLPLAAAPSPED